MVAHTATTPDPRATDPLRVSASPPSAPSLSSPSDSWRSSSALSSLLPPPTLTDEILDDLAIPQFSLAIVAQKHGLTLSGMLTWLNLPETREVLALRESAAYAHARHVAALNIGHAVETVASIVRDYNTTRPEREAQDRKAPGSAHRAATNARKAAWLLLQFARIVPVNEADLRHATGCLSASARSGTPVPSPAHRTPSVSEGMSDTLNGSVSERMSSNSDNRATGCAVGGSASANNTTSTPWRAHRTANVSERTSSSDSSLPSPTLHAAGVLLDLPPASALKAEADSPLASSLKDDANSSQVACLLEEQACSESANSPHGCAIAAMPPDCAELSPHSRVSVPSCALSALASNSPSRGPPW